MQKGISKQEAERRVEAVQRFLEEGFKPPGTSLKQGEIGAITRAAQELGIPNKTLGDSVGPNGACAKQGVFVDWSLWNPSDEERKRQAARGEFGFKPVLPGYEIKTTSSKVGDTWVKQERAHGEVFETHDDLALKGRSTLIDGEKRVIQQWILERDDAKAAAEKMRAVVEALKEEIPRIEPVAPPSLVLADLVAQYVVTDLHFGMMSWKEETGADYDLKIAEKLLLDWFATAIALAPAAENAVFAQLGDLLHHDGHDSVTPTHHNVLDSDSRLQKVIRVVIKTLRRIVAMLLEKHKHVHIVMADANHDPASEAWLREMFAAFYEDEPRVTVERSASTYYAYEHGKTSLFYHHGHKRKTKDVDSVFAGKFREIYGRTQFSYGHTGHLHNDELISTNLMKVERHETLAAPDAYAANGGWLSGRSAKLIVYHKKFGEVGRQVICAAMAADPDAVRIYGADA